MKEFTDRKCSVLRSFLSRKYLLVLVTLSTLVLAVPIHPARAAGSPPLLKGWGGVGIAESDQNSTAPSSTVFPGEHASNMEQAFANLTRKGLNAERVLFYNPLTANKTMVGKGVKSFNYTDARLGRTLSIAQHFGIWLVLNEHQNCDWANETSICYKNFGDTVYKFSNVQGNWTSFWQNNITRIALNSGYSNFMYEPLNEPIVSNQTINGKVYDTKINGQNQTRPGNPQNLVIPYENFISLIRNTVGDTTHYIIASNAEWDGDFPSLTDPAGLVFLTHHFYYEYGNAPKGCTQPGHVVPGYNSTGAYVLSTYCGWSVSNAQLYADNVTSYFRTAQSRFGWPIISTEAGADFISNSTAGAPTDYVLAKGACKYASSTASFIQQLINDLSQSPSIGYQLWMNGDWGGPKVSSIYGCLSWWGKSLTYPLTVQGPYLAAQTSEEDQPQYWPWSSTSFYAQGRHWVFYENHKSCPVSSGRCLTYAYSADSIGTSFTSGNSINVLSPTTMSAVSNGTHVFYARYNSTGGLGTTGQPIMFRIGKLNINGTISWQPETTVKAGVAGQLFFSINMALSSTGQAFVAYRNATVIGGSGFAYTIHSAGTNYSSWTQQTQLSTSSDDWRFSWTSLNSGQMYLLYWPTQAALTGRLWNTNWGSEETISPSGTNVRKEAFVFNNNTNTPTVIWQEANTEKLNIRQRVSGNWGTTTQIATAETNSLPRWTVSFDPYHYKYYLVYYNYTTNEIYQYSGYPGSWSARTHLINTVGGNSTMTIASDLIASQLNTSQDMISIYFTQNTGPITSYPQLEYADELVP